MRRELMEAGTVFERAFRGATAMLACAVLAAAGARGQSSAVSPVLTSDAHVKLPAFDIVSIKPDKSGSGSMSIDSDKNHFDASNVTLKMMIEHAYEIKEAQLFGLPKWGESAHFDIKAKVSEPDKKALEALTNDQSREMLQPILTEQFKLKYHLETKVLPVYELVVAKGGPKLTASKVVGDADGSMNIGNRDMTATGMPLISLAFQLSSQLRRVVVDKTGLKGNFDFTLTWAPDDGGPQAEDATAPSIFTALEEQLGLRLQTGKAPVETFVIDSVEMPNVD